MRSIPLSSFVFDGSLRLRNSVARVFQSGRYLSSVCTPKTGSDIDVSASCGSRIEKALVDSDNAASGLNGVFLILLRVK
jgi:hypothetical protein